MLTLSKKLFIVGVASLALSGCSSTKLPGKTGEGDKTTTASAIFSGKESGICILSDATKATETKMEYTVKGKKMAMKSINAGVKAGAADANNPMITNMINDNGVIYTWRNGEKTGVKISQVQPTGAADASSPANQAAQLEKNPDYQVDCKITPIDDQAFAIPTDVTFTSFDKK
jgi:hypothetical protein